MINHDSPTYRYNTYMTTIDNNIKETAGLHWCSYLSTWSWWQLIICHSKFIWSWRFEQFNRLSKQRLLRLGVHRTFEFFHMLIHRFFTHSHSKEVFAGDARRTITNMQSLWQFQLEPAGLIHVQYQQAQYIVK